MSLRLPYRGGNWNNTSNAGVFALNLLNARSNSNTNIGFRSALVSQVRSRTPTGDGQRTKQKGHISPLRDINGAKNLIAVKAVSSRRRRRILLRTAQMRWNLSKESTSYTRAFASLKIYMKRTSKREKTNVSASRYCCFRRTWQKTL